ncbi:MAG: orotate phosphoribosyltransferase [Archaeoglobi archaeon]|nr:orotate phosphoribosyltransferase [Candidatus Mnemosynella sp.]MBC7114889.1 orotate phosphoribosyltransferase [Candidatus Mnemosynella bozhongmuii]MDI3502411.1 orotate phosphoribosyltransferase [Archaeoglobi archaeon]MDK2781205.1 orotate phosphoribosyltransferase [Archaeoglobi archaeon]
MLEELIKRSGAIKFGDFLLRSGKRSHYYIDKYMFETDPEALRGIAEEIAKRIDPRDFDRVAGVELGGVPLAVAVSLKTGLKSLFIRKRQKEYGTANRIEGDFRSGMRILLVEDVVTTGGALLDAINIIEEAGGIVKKIFVVVDRMEGGVERIREKYDVEVLTNVRSLGISEEIRKS